jgi:flavin-dependent dehydrogenase
VLGGGPAGSFFGYFLMDFAERVGIDLEVDLYEAKDFSRPAPHGCNMCGGIVSESLVQTLATEGVMLPGTVVQRGIDSYVLHMDEGSIRIQTPLFEKRIGAIHRGSGPRDVVDPKWESFDGHLLKLAIDKGVKLTRTRVVEVTRDDGRPRLKTRDGRTSTYDLLAVATGVNTASKKLFEGQDFSYEFPRTTRTYIQERLLGEDTVSRVLGNSMHVFLLDIPRLDFAAIIPKGDYVTICLLGEGIDEALAREFLESPSVKKCLPAEMQARGRSCNCFPRINVRGAAQPFSDRIVFIGDCAVTKLFKDGIGAAYRTAKAAARTSIFRGVSADSFRKHYLPLCKRIARDNLIGKMTFAVAGKAQRRSFARRTILRMVAFEQQKEGRQPRISTVLWDMFTGSASYGEIVLRSMRPAFILSLLRHLGCCILRPKEGCLMRRNIDE